jgi:hypothetical protein
MSLVSEGQIIMVLFFDFFICVVLSQRLKFSVGYWIVVSELYCKTQVTLPVLSNISLVPFSSLRFVCAHMHVLICPAVNI